MKIKLGLVTSLVVVSAMLCSVATHAQDMDREHPLTFVKDSAITGKIKAKLANERMNTLIHISVDTDDHGVVVLSGHTKSQERADRAVVIARDTDGVTKVWNHIQIRADD